MALAIPVVVHDSYLSSGADQPSASPHLSHIRVIDDLSDTDMPVNELSTTSFLGTALPPVPHKLVKKIKAGAFVKWENSSQEIWALQDDELKQKPRYYGGV